MMKKINGTKLRAIVLCALAALCGIVLAAFRTRMLFGAYDPDTGLYPKCPDTAAFELGMILLSISLALGGLMFITRKDCSATPRPIARCFTGALLGFGFCALGISTFIATKMNTLPLSRFDGVLIVLSLVCAASFFMELKDGVLGKEASVVLMLFRPVCCLFVSFYFYFDSSTVIHDSNKKMATLFFATVLLALLYEVKMKLVPAKIPVFASLNALSLAYSIMYGVPNIVWYFTQGESLMLSIFFDIVVVMLGLWSVMCILSVSSPETACETAEGAEMTKEPLQPTAEDAEPVTNETFACSESPSAFDASAQDEAFAQPKGPEEEKAASDAGEIEI